MLALDSPRWSTLTHAYGPAEDVPDMLETLSMGRPAMLDQLWGAICHQGTVYTASYAAVPHLVEIARAAQKSDLRAQILVLIGAIAASSDRAELPEDLRADYEAAFPRALELSLKTLADPIEPSEAVHVLGAAAALAGKPLLERALQGFTFEEFVIECPGCEHELYLWPDGDGLTAAAEDPVRHKETRRSKIVPGPEPTWKADYDWLVRNAGEAASSIIARRLPSLFGRGTCPGCGDEFSVMDQLEANS